jgi:hypothetical protein
MNSFCSQTRVPNGVSKSIRPEPHRTYHRKWGGWVDSVVWQKSLILNLHIWYKILLWNIFFGIVDFNIYAPTSTIELWIYNFNLRWVLGTLLHWKINFAPSLIATPHTMSGHLVGKDRDARTRHDRGPALPSPMCLRLTVTPSSGLDGSVANNACAVPFCERNAFEQITLKKTICSGKYKIYCC